MDFFRGRYSWRKLLALVLQFDRTSKWREAQLNDEEWAREVVNLPALQRDAAPPMSSFSPEVELLTYIGEALQSIRAVLVQLGHGKPDPVRPLPRPVTALDRIRDAERIERLTSLVDEAEAAMRRCQEMTGG